MKYISTRGGAAPQSFTDVLLSGMAPDGGLYVPQQWPRVDFAALRGKSYAQIAEIMVAPFIEGDIDRQTLRRLLHETYESGSFDHADVAPLTKLDDKTSILELFHGPTFSFKDYALQFLGRLFDHVLAARGERLTIVGATSGDTGSAAIEACRGSRHIDIYILHPHNRTSDVQRRQMTSVDAPNVRNIAIEGTFDDCQALVKMLFADEKLRCDLNLSAVNSINWVRIMMQTVYYAAAAARFDGPVSFSVPTGNFGNVYAAYCAKKMGVPVDRLVIGTNRNDILTRFFETGEMKIDKVVPSLSPSMDIQVSSNFERYLFDLTGCDAAAVTALMKQFAAQKHFAVGADQKKSAQDAFFATRCTDEDTIALMSSVYKETGITIDPHTAVGLNAGRKANVAGSLVTLACAHPAKFPDAVKRATGRDPQMPAALAAVMDKKEHYTVLPADLAKLTDFIRK